MNLLDKLPWWHDRVKWIKIPSSDLFPPSYRFRSSSGMENVVVIQNELILVIGDRTTVGTIQID